LDSVWLVARAEARSLSRSPTLYVVRTAYVAVALALGMVFGAEDRSRELFAVERELYLLVGLGLTPLLVALAATREPAGALDLLLVTRLSPRALVLGQLLGRLLLPMSTLLGLVPVLALVVWLGGVSDQEVLAAAAGGAALHLSTGALAGGLAQRTGAVVPSVLLALTVARGWCFDLPGSALGAAIDGTVGAPLLVGLVGPAVVAARARAILERHRGARVGWAAALAAGPAVGLAHLLARPEMIWLAQALLALAALELGSAWLLRRQDPARPSREVTDNPVTWWATRARAGWLLVAGWSLWLLHSFWQTPGDPQREAELDPGRILLIAGVATTAAAAAHLSADGRPMIEALRLTPLGQPALVRGLLAGIAIRSLPWLLAGAALRGRPELDLPWILAWWWAAASLTSAIGLRLSAAGAWAASLLGAYSFIQLLALAPLMADGERLVGWLAPPLLPGSERPALLASLLLHLAVGGVASAAMARAAADRLRYPPARGAPAR
jgi:hypothetical protein